jgi:hypothetical protein
MERQRQEAEVQQREAARLRDLARLKRLWEGDARILKWAVVLCVTVVAPVFAGRYLAVEIFEHFPGESRVTDLQELFAADWFSVGLFLWTIGSAALAVVTALILILRFRWFSRPKGTVFAVVLLVGGGFVLLARDSVAEDLLEPARDAFVTSVVPLQKIEDLCGRHTTWTNASLATRAVVNGESCNTIELYRGWDLSWEFKASGPIVGDFVSMGGAYIVTVDSGERSGQSIATKLEAVDHSTGKLLWDRNCPSGWTLDTSQRDAGANTPATQRLGTICSNPLTWTWLDPMTGDAVP